MIETRADPAEETTDERTAFRTGADWQPGNATGGPRGERLLAGRYGERRIRRVDWNRAKGALRRALELEAALGTPFLFVPAGVLVGAVIYFGLPAEPAPHNLPLALAFLLAAAVIFRSRAIRRLIVAVGLIVSGMLVAQVHSRFAGTQMLGSAVTTHMIGRIRAIEERSDGRTRLTVDVMSTKRPKLYYPPDRVRATMPGKAGEFNVGDGVSGVLRLMPASGPARPGGYDFAFYNFHEGIGANGFFFGRPSKVSVNPEIGFAEQVRDRVERLRRLIGHNIRSVAPGRAGAVSAALVTGDKAPIPEPVTDALRLSGLAHILSISGLHMALVAATVMFTFRFLFALAPNWASARPVRKYAAGAALAATGFYLFLAGAGVATQRSFVMLAIMLAALAFDRNAVTMRNLSLAAIVVICISPDAVTGPGFQMSFAATAALIAVYGAWRDRRHGAVNGSAAFVGMSGIRSWLWKAGGYLGALAVTSLVAGFATGIFAVFHFGRIAPYGLLANLAAMPLMSVMVMPMAIVGVVAMPFGLHALPFKLMAWAVELVIRVAETVAAMSPAAPMGSMPATAMMLFASGLVIFCFLSSRLRWFALTFGAAGMMAWLGSNRPVGVVSEDARQFAVIDPRSGEIHVNRKRPASFILDQWTTAYAIRRVVKPDASSVMRCVDADCVADITTGSGSFKIGYLADPATIHATREGHQGSDPCKLYDLVILAAAPSPQACATGTPVISAQMLALRGSAEIYLKSASRGPPKLEIRYALPGPSRPWLDHRRYSRAARNLAPWKPKDGQ